MNGSKFAASSLVQLPTRGLFFGRRLLNKPLKRQGHFKHSYDSESYLLALKKFQKMTRGVVKGSSEYDELRNQVYAELRQQKQDQKAKDAR